MEILVKNIVLKSNNDVEVGFLYKKGPIYEELKEKKAKITVFDNSNNVITMAKNIIKYCEKQNIDIINVHDGGLKSLLIYYIILKTSKIKMVRTVHSDEIEVVDFSIRNKIKKKITYIFMKSTMKLSDKVICVSKAVEKSLRDTLGLKNTVVIYNGIEKENIVIKREAKFNNRVVFCGRLSKEKGVDILIKSLNILIKKKNKDLELIIVGDGEERKKLEEKSNKYQLMENIKFKGFQNNVWDFLDNSSIFVYPVMCNEAFGISIVEAMARGCIPIAFKKGGIPEIISNGENGFLVDKLNENKLAKVILRIYELDEQEKNKIINNAIETASRFTIDNTVNKLEEEYKNVYN